MAAKTLQDLINNAKGPKASKSKPAAKAGKPTIKQANGKFKGIVVTVTAEVKKGKPVTLNVVPKDQDADVTRIKSRARQVLRRFLRASDIQWTGFSTELLEGVSAEKAKKLSTYTHPTKGSQFAVCP